jgi:hypothetical protein
MMSGTPWVTSHGGAVIPHVEVDTVYYGQGWNQPASGRIILNTGAGIIGQLDQYFATLTQSSYMSMLGEYGVGQGHFGKDDIVTNSASPASGATVSEGEVQNMLQTEIANNRLPTPNGSQVYMVFLPPGVHSQFDLDNGFLAHHNSFQMQVFSGYRYVQSTAGMYLIAVPYYRTQTVTYAVMPYPGGGNPVGTSLTALTPFQQLTEEASHELSEAVTNPDEAVLQIAFPNGTPNPFYLYFTTNPGSGWYDDTTGNEIGDIANQYYGTFDGYIVQREWSNFYKANILPTVDSSYFGSSPYLYAGVNQNFTGSLNGHTLLVSVGPAGIYTEWQIGANDYSGWMFPPSTLTSYR